MMCTAWCMCIPEAEAAAGVAAGAAAATLPERSALFLAFMSFVTLRKPDVTSPPCHPAQSAQAMAQRIHEQSCLGIKRVCYLLNQVAAWSTFALC